MAMGESAVRGYSAADQCLLCQSGDSADSAAASAAESAAAEAVVLRSLSVTLDSLGPAAVSGSEANKQSFQAVINGTSCIDKTVI